jgi:enoyl-CoA hydratase/carnithine racemase
LSARDFVALEIRDRIAIVTLDRPDSLNAISNQTARELGDVCEEIAHNDEVWAVVLRGNGEKAFCVGADLKERGSFTQEDYFENRKHMRRMFDGLRALPQPSVAAVFGFALGGGCELALSCDLIVAAEGTQLGLPETRVGLLPAGGGTQLLSRRAGLARAKEIIFTARRFDADEGLRIGVIAKVVARSELDDAALGLARDVCKNSPVAVREAKRSIDASLGHPLGEALEIENESWRRVVTSEDRSEGIAAFNEKRDPRWKNR